VNGKNNDLNFIGNAALLLQINLVARFFVFGHKFFVQEPAGDTWNKKIIRRRIGAAIYFARLRIFRDLRFLFPPHC
jgi:hypothetical protein